MSHDDPATARYSPSAPRPRGERTAQSPMSGPSRSEPFRSANDSSHGSIDSPLNGSAAGGWSRKRRWLTTLITPVVVVVMAVGGHRAWTWQAERKLGALVDEL